nr:MAG: putative RNA dependent RNA polymerase [Ilomantsi reovirus 1]UUV42395.1 MAG: putative RNA dependent RNA polymerase [Ilomantsi reovirus 1]
MFASITKVDFCQDLILKVQSVFQCQDPVIQFEREVDIFSNLLSIRNGRIPVYSDPGVTGTLYSSSSDPQVNEQNFSNMYETVFALNAHDVPEIEIVKYDRQLNDIIDALDTAPMWYELTVESLTASPTPECRVASLPYYKQRNSSLLTDRLKVKEYPMFESYHEFKDRKIVVDNDFFISGKKETPLIRVLQFRLNEELNSHYVTHPSEFMLTYILTIKASCNTYFDYGLRFFELFMLRIRDESYPYFHLPIEYRSDGAFVGAQYHSRLPLLLRIVINRLSLLIYYQLIHNFDDEYLTMYNELMIYFLQNPSENGRKFKKAFTAVNLYYGMDVKYPLPHGVDFAHSHPWYELLESDLSRRPPAFNSQTDCIGGCMHGRSERLDRACYSREVRIYVETAVKDVAELGLTHTSEFIKRRLIASRYNDGIIKDLIAVRMSMGALGYARSHKIADVVDDIIENYEHNITHAETPEYKELGPKLRARLHAVGFNQTRRLLDEGKYPTSEHFHSSISSYLTSKSSGAAPITVSYTLKDKTTGITKQMRQSLTSKAARAMFSGENVFDISSIRPKFRNVIDYYNQLSTLDQIRIQKEGLSDTDVKAIGISSIGSRATTGTRAIRGIFVIPIQLHMALCAVMKPHVDDTSKPPEAGDTNAVWINEDNYGSSILTQFQDGSADAYAPFIQASSSRSFIISAADASAWDQHCKFDLMAAWIEGIRDAFRDFSPAHNEYYMYLHGNGLTLPEICDEIIEFLRFGLFSVTYGDSTRIVKTNFMLSGLLVTFLLNSIINAEINFAMLQDLDLMSVRTISMLIAGDDIGSILKMENANAGSIETLRELICAKYTAAGHKINKNKSVMSNRSIEMAKIYAHLGFMFNDPYMQVNESEKTGKEDSRVTSLRGFAHKQFDAFRRASSDTRVTCFVMRMCTMMAYHLKTFSRNADSAHVKLKYYPPYAASIIPSAIKGGIGCSWTGTSLNEVIWIQERMSGCVASSIDIVDALRFDSQEIFANAFLKNVIPRNKHHLIPKPSRQVDLEIMSVSVKSTNAKDAPLSIDAGIQYKMRHLKPDRITLSNQAYQKLSNDGVQVDDGLRYENAPIVDMIQFSATLKRAVTANRDEFTLNIHKLFDIENMKPNFHIVPKSLYSYYKLYGMVDYHVNFHDVDVQQHRYRAVRRPITPNTYINAERRHGARYGEGVRLNLMGLNKALQRFVNKTGAHVTAESIQAAMIKYDMFMDVNSETKLIDFLTVISGDLSAATQAVHEMRTVDHTWSDMMVASTVNGTCAEYLDIKMDEVSKLIFVAAKVIPSPIARLLQYSAFNYLLACESYFSRTMRTIQLVQNQRTMRLIADTKKSSRRVKVKAKSSSVIVAEELYETFERLNLSYEVNHRMLIDENKD